MGHPLGVGFAEVPGPLRFDFYSSGVGCAVVTVAAPGPIVGGFHQASFDGIAVDVLQLLDELAVGEDVEVVVAGLPRIGGDRL
jgi:hypothetical protein